MIDCDALIVGGGPAGSTLAWRLAARGWKVVVLDKHDFPRDKVCAGWITPAVLESLQIDGDDYARGRTLQAIRGFRTGFAGHMKQRLTRYDETVSYGIRRREFDNYLLRRSGADLALGEALADAQREGDRWIVNQRWRTPLLIGAGGHYCPVARLLGAQLGAAENPVTAQEAEFVLTDAQRRECRVAADVPELFFTPELDGYGWVVRKGEVLNVGLGREGGGRRGDDVNAFVRWLQDTGKLPGEIPARLHGHAYLFFSQRQPRRLFDDGVLLIGDAAGLAYPQSGEGIRPAVESALLAAELILRAQGDYRAARLQPYEEKLAARFGRRQASSASALPWLPPSWRQYLARTLLGNAWFARHVVLNRWFLHRGQTTLR